MSLTLAGTLVLFTRGDTLVQPFIGYLADRTGLRYFVIVAPSLTATGFYIAFAMIVSGVSTALLGALADVAGLAITMDVVAFLPLLAVPLTLMLPETRERSLAGES